MSTHLESQHRTHGIQGAFDSRTKLFESLLSFSRVSASAVSTPSGSKHLQLNHYILPIIGKTMIHLSNMLAGLLQRIEGRSIERVRRPCRGRADQSSRANHHTMRKMKGTHQSISGSILAESRGLTSVGYPIFTKIRIVEFLGCLRSESTISREGRLALSCCVTISKGIQRTTFALGSSARLYASIETSFLTAFRVPVVPLSAVPPSWYRRLERRQTPSRTDLSYLLAERDFMPENTLAENIVQCHPTSIVSREGYRRCPKISVFRNSETLSVKIRDAANEITAAQIHPPTLRCALFGSLSFKNREAAARWASFNHGERSPLLEDDRHCSKTFAAAKREWLASALSSRCDVLRKFASNAPKRMSREQTYEHRQLRLKRIFYFVRRVERACWRRSAKFVQNSAKATLSTTRAYVSLLGLFRSQERLYEECCNVIRATFLRWQAVAHASSMMPFQGGVRCKSRRYLIDVQSGVHKGRCLRRRAKDVKDCIHLQKIQSERGIVVEIDRRWGVGGGPYPTQKLKGCMSWRLPTDHCIPPAHSGSGHSSLRLRHGSKSVCTTPRGFGPLRRTLKHKIAVRAFTGTRQTNTTIHILFAGLHGICRLLDRILAIFGLCRKYLSCNIKLLFQHSEAGTLLKSVHLGAVGIQGSTARVDPEPPEACVHRYMMRSDKYHEGEVILKVERRFAIHGYQTPAISISDKPKFTILKPTQIHHPTSTCTINSWIICRNLEASQTVSKKSTNPGVSTVSQQEYPPMDIPAELQTMIIIHLGPASPRDLYGRIMRHRPITMDSDARPDGCYNPRDVLTDLSPYPATHSNLFALFPNLDSGRIDAGNTFKDLCTHLPLHCNLDVDQIVRTSHVGYAWKIDGLLIIAAPGLGNLLKPSITRALAEEDQAFLALACRLGLHGGGCQLFSSSPSPEADVTRDTTGMQRQIYPHPFTWMLDTPIKRKAKTELQQNTASCYSDLGHHPRLEQDVNGGLLAKAQSFWNTYLKPSSNEPYTAVNPYHPKAIPLSPPLRNGMSLPNEQTTKGPVRSFDPVLELLDCGHKLHPCRLALALSKDMEFQYNDHGPRSPHSEGSLLTACMVDIAAYACLCLTRSCWDEGRINMDRRAACYDEKKSLERIKSWIKKYLRHSRVPITASINIFGQHSPQSSEQPYAEGTNPIQPHSSNLTPPPTMRPPVSSIVSTSFNGAYCATKTTSRSRVITIDLGLFALSDDPGSRSTDTIQAVVYDCHLLGIYTNDSTWRMKSSGRTLYNLQEAQSTNHMQTLQREKQLTFPGPRQHYYKSQGGLNLVRLINTSAELSLIDFALKESNCKVVNKASLTIKNQSKIPLHAVSKLGDVSRRLIDVVVSAGEAVTESHNSEEPRKSLSWPAPHKPRQKGCELFIPLVYNLVYNLLFALAKAAVTLVES
ncbi:uncharacterized protein BDR25DRAFT_349196 [Lindgomyces ingoldianus]|uniref:Uncharacterized protein n=1 Tax=Lindgomyces ingoldianus TaxID=673940 RepID=A0ACB6REV6_9PLEO|nr:uncharacterized protein BDR25DRAFT_349196 [Lindgomyces ingoldianus]KAF2477250.1 hypothetical protein BDR25DRAFT_349196 [Lindgomyces ingoldianus]